MPTLSNVRLAVCDRARGGGDRSPRPTGRRAGPRVLVAAACLAVCAALVAFGDGGALLKTILIAPGEHVLNVTLVTDGREPPAFSTFVLDNPPRLSIDLVRVQIGASFTPPRPTARLAVKHIVVAQVPGDRSQTRVTFELATSADHIRYHVRPVAGTGCLLVQFRPKKAARPVAGPTPRPALSEVEGPAPHLPQSAQKRQGSSRGTPSPATARGPGASPRASLRTLLARGSAARGKGGAGAPPAEAQGGMHRPGPARPPRAAPGRAQYSSYGGRAPLAALIVLAVLLGAIAATAGWRWLHLRRRAQGRRAWLEHALSSTDALQRLSALRLVSVWPTPDVAAVADLLIMAADHLSHPESGVAGAIVRERFPADALIERMRRGTGGGRARAAQLLALHPTETVVEALLDAAISARGVVRKAVIESLARLLCQQPVRKLLQALSSSDASLRSVAVEAVQQAGPRSGPVLRRALADPDETIRCMAIEALTLVPSPGSAQAIAGLLSDPSDHVRVRAASGLGALGTDEGTASALLAGLNDPNAEVQNQVGLALIELGNEHLGELALALDRRASEDLSFRASEELLAAMAAKMTQPVPAYEHALASLNRGFAGDLARALERNGNLDSWVAQLAELEGEQRRSAIAVLGAAALAGAIAPILRGVELPDAKIRESCARLLGETALPAVVGPLRELLSDPEEGLRTTAVEALARIDAPDASECLISALGDPSPRVRAKAAEGLRSALRLRQSASASAAAAEVSRRSVEALLRAVHDVSAAVREQVVQALGAARTEKAVDLLVDMALHDPEAEVRAAAIAALGEMEAYDVLPFLVLDVVNSDDRDLRARVMEMLSHTVDPIVLEPMMSALQDSDETVRAVAGRGLWDVVSSEQCQSLLPYLNSPDAKVRAAVVGVLGKTRSAEWAATLAAAAADPDPHVRAAIVNALGRIGEGAAPHLDAIISRMTDTDAYVRSRAAEAAFLVAPHHPELAQQVLKLASDPDGSVKSAAVASLVNFARNGVQDALVQLLTDAGHRELAISALADVEDDLLRRILAHAQKTRPEMAPSVTEALSRVLAGRRTVEDLRPVLSSLDTEVRMAGLEDLSLVRQDDATHEIIRLLASDPVSRVRLRAAQILSTRSGSSLPAQQALRRAAATDPDEGVRRVAQDAVQSTPEQGTQLQP